MKEYTPFKSGKVREVYDAGDSIIMVATDRISAFDHILKNKITMAYDWHLGSGLSLVLMVFIIVNMVVTAYFDRSEGQVKK